MIEEANVLIELVPIDRIAVLNPRGRSRRVHREVIDSIEAVGLKRPITVSRRRTSDGVERYDLICGEGRIEAFQALGQTQIPAIILEMPEEDRSWPAASLKTSLVPNIAASISCAKSERSRSAAIPTPKSLRKSESRRHGSA